jgi:hypothetical protein
VTKIVQLLVTVEVPSSVGMQELHAYVHEAVQIWGGQRHPNDHLFDMHKPVSVRTVAVVQKPRVRVERPH